MAKYKIYLGKNEIEYEIDESQKLFPENSKIQTNIKPDANYLDTSLCDIPNPPEDTVKIPNIPFTDIPSPMPQIEVPKTILAALLPCAKKGLFPCPDLRLVDTFEMTEEEVADCTKKDTLIIPVSLKLLYDDSNPDYDFTDDPAVDDIIGRIYIRPFFVSKCCCDAENEEDVIEITAGLFYEILEPELSLPRIKFPCPDITFTSNVKDGSCANHQDAGKIELDITSEVDEEDCRKMNINADLSLSIPDMVKSIRWEDVASTGCLIQKKLVVDRSDLVVSNGKLEFCNATRTEDLGFAPIEESGIGNVNNPITGNYTVIGSISHSQSGNDVTISWQELVMSFNCGRLVSVNTGNSGSVTIQTSSSGGGGGQGEHLDNSTGLMD